MLVRIVDVLWFLPATVFRVKWFKDCKFVKAFHSRLVRVQVFLLHSERILGNKLQKLRFVTSQRKHFFVVECKAG